jgi:hypothetical protein
MTDHHPPIKAGSAAARPGPGHAWVRRAAELAAWTDALLVNRRDAFGHYIPLEKRTDPDRTAITDKSGLTLTVLERHFRGESAGDLVGLHSTARDEATAEGEVPACWSRWLAVDIDRHDESIDPEATRRAALALRDRAVAPGFRPLLLDSNGNGGYHLLIVFGGPVPTGKVYAFGRWLIRDWQALGLDSEPEIFPKQATIAAGGFGNWLRLAGRHHSRDHHTRVWSGEVWLDGDEAVRAILATEGDPPDLIPPEALEPSKPPRKPKGPIKPADNEKDATLAAAALDYLDPSMPYPEWLEIGMSLTPLGRDGLDLWDHWSAGSDKYRDGDCDRKWRSFSRTGRTLGSLFHLAKARGFEFPKAERDPGRSRGSAPGTNGHAGHQDQANGHHATIGQADDDEGPEIVDRWPRMDEAAYRGIAGEIVRMASPETEADPVAILIQLLVGFGSALGRTVYWTAGATRHHCVLFAAIVGATASARKGSAWDVVEFILSCLDETWSPRRIVGGLSSGEGLIYHVRDRVMKPGKDGGEADEVDPGEADKRLLCVEREFGRTLKTMAAPYNTLSSVLRQCWDGPTRLGTLTKTSTNVATGAHVSVIAHITNQELLALLSEIDSASGLGNRFLWICVRKSRPLPHGGRFHELPWGPIQGRLRAAFEQARGYSRVDFDAEVRRAWEDAYGLLTQERPGLLGLMLARAEAQVRRLACLYALLEGRREIGMGHLESALAVWDYCESSAKFIFGQTLGDADAEKLLDALRRAPEGLTRTEITRDVFQKNKTKEALGRLLDRLFNLGVIHRTAAPTGRPGPVPERWLCGRESNNQT